MFYWLLKRIILGPVLHAIFRPWVRGEEHVPETGGAILASNHLSFSDSIFLPLVLKRRVTFLAKSDYFTGRGLKGRLTAAFIKGAGQLPVDRSGGQASEAALRTGLKVLRRGDGAGDLPRGHALAGRAAVPRQDRRRPARPRGRRARAARGHDRDRQGAADRPEASRGSAASAWSSAPPWTSPATTAWQDDRFVLRSITDEIMYGSWS